MAAAPNKAPDIIKICVIGPECTGKTDLSRYLAEYYKTNWVEEYARVYLNRLGRPYEQADLTMIAHGQIRMEDEWLHGANNLLICDTNLLVIKVWSESKYGNCDPEILRTMKEQKYNGYLLTNIDIPWEADPQREHPDKREYFWNIYKKEVQDSGVPFTEISGSREERRSKAISAIDNLMLTRSNEHV